MRDDFPKRITKWAEVQALKDAGRLKPAELKLIEAAQTGEGAIIGTAVPTTKSDAVLIRAPLIRYLALGGCEDCEVEAAGVQVMGAWIDGVIDLNFATAKGRLALVHCHIADRIELLQCTLPGLNLTGNTLPKALNAQGAQFAGDVVLNEVTADGEVCLSSATIGGQLACVGAKLRNADGKALNAHSTQIAGGVFLRGATADGEVCLSGATIGGQLSCVGGKLSNLDGFALNAQGAQITEGVFLRGATADGEVCLSGATIHGQLSCVGATFRNLAGKAINLQRTVVKDGLYWRDIKAVTGELDLNSAHVADLADDAASWAKCDTIRLANFSYDTISPDVTVTDRLEWLRKGSDWNGAFHPQPYEQLAKVLNQSGHKTEARAILVEKEKVQRRATRQFWRGERKLARLVRRHSRKPIQYVNEKWRAIQKGTPAITGTANEMLERYNLFHDHAKNADVAKYIHAQVSPVTQKLAQKDFRNQQFWRAGWLRCRIGANWAWDWLLRGVIGYGYKPQRSAYTLALLVVVGWALAAGAWKAGDFAPNSDVILDSTEWQALATDRETYPNPAREWSGKYNEEIGVQGRGQDYATFNSFYYAIDVVVPIIALGQEAAWAPSTNRGPWGWWLWVFNPILTLLGWLVTAIGAAAVTGVIRKE